MLECEAGLLLGERGSAMTEYGNLHFTKQTNGHVKGYMHWYDAKGKRHQISRTSSLKKVTQAKAEIREWSEEVKAQGRKSLSIGTRTNKKTVEEVCTDYLDYQLSKGKLEKSSYAMQVSVLKANAFPYIGGITFGELNKDAIEVWLTKLSERGLKQGTIHGIYAHVAKVYKYWYKQGELAANPFEFVDTPSKSECKKTFLDKEQLDRLVSCLNDYAYVDSPLYIAVELALLAGLRRGEICALRWYDVDLESGMLSVSSAIGVANGTYTKPPKNKSSIRTFPMVEQLIEILKCRKDYVAKTYGTVDSSWFVCGDTIRYYSPTSLSRDFKAFVQEYDLRDHYQNEVKLHSLRHNFATLGVKSMMDIASLSVMMGHASKSMTLDTYADASPQAMQLAKKVLTNGFEIESEYLPDVTKMEEQGLSH